MRMPVLFVVAFISLLTVGVLSFLAQPIYPLDEFRNENGGITIPGGRFTPELQRALFGPGPDPTIETMVWLSEPSAYPTLSWQSYEFSRPNPNVYVRSPVKAEKPYPLFKEVWLGAQELGQAILDGARYVFSFDWLMSRASAVAKVWDNGGADTNWNTCANWDLDTCPVAADGVTFDTGDGAVTVNIATPALADFTMTAAYANTITVTLAQTASWGVFDINAGTLATGGLAITVDRMTLDGGTFTAGASTITINGPGTSTTAAGVFGRGTSTITVAGAATFGTWAAFNADGTGGFYSLTVNVSTTLTLGAFNYQIDNTFTLNGTATGPSASIQMLVDTGDPATPFTAGAGAVISGISDFQYRVGNIAADTTFNVPGLTYPILLFFSLQTHGGVITFASQAALTTTDFRVNGDDNGTTGTIAFTTTASNFGLTINGPLQIGDVAPAAQTGRLLANGSTVSVTGATSIRSLGAIQFGSSTWTVSGSWTNATTNATDWDAGTGTVTFDSATGGTPTFAGANIAEAEFNSVTFTSSAGTAQTFTMATRGIRWLTTLTVSDTSSTTALATADLALGAAADTAAIAIGNGGILTANASTVIINAFTMTGGTSGTLTITTGAWTVSGNWNSSGAGSVFTQGTGIHTFDATATITLLSTDNTFDDLTVSAGTVTLATAVVVTNALTISGGTFAKSTFAITSAGSLTMSGGDLTGASGDVAITGAVNISSAASAIDFGSEAWTISGAWTNSSTDGTVWDAGTGTVTFDSATAVTLTLGVFSPVENEFNAVTFASTGAGSITFTLATNPLRAGGAVTVNSDTVLAKGTLTMVLASTLTIGGTGTNAITSTSGDVTVTGAVSISNAASYIDLGSETWTLSGSWTNSTTSASWDAGTGTVTFDSATAQTMTFAGANLAEDEFSALTFASTAAGSITFTMATRGLRAGGAVTVNSDTILAKATLALTFASTLTIGGTGTNAITSTSGAVSITGAVNISNAASYIDFGSETWTLSGAWTNSTTSASWDAGTGTVTFDSATAATMTFAGANLAEDEFNNVTFNSTAAGSITFTMATRGLRWADAGTLTINGDTVLAKATFTLTGGALTVGGTGTNALTSTSGDVDLDGAVNISNAASYIDLGSEAWTVTGTWTNSSTSASWDAGTGTVTFDNTVASTMTFAGANLAEIEFAGITFNSAASTAITFTMATRALSWGSTLTITDVTSTTTLDAGSLTLDGDGTSAILVEANGRLTFTTGDITDISDLDLRAGQMTMDGVSGITDFDIETHDTDYTAAIADFDITFWTLYSITSGGVPDIRWTMDPSVSTATLFIEIEGLTATTTFAIYRDEISIQEAATNGAGLLRFADGTMNSGWSSHRMIVALPGLTFGGGGGGGGGAVPDPTILWTWRHLSEDLTIEFTVQGSLSAEYRWFFGDRLIGSGKRFEYQFQLSGEHEVVLVAKILDKEVRTPQKVVATSLTFLGRYLPPLALVLVAMWFIILVLADVYRSDAGRFYGMLVALGGFGLAIWLLNKDYLTFPVNSQTGIQLFAAVGLIAAGGTLKSRIVGFVFMAIGAILAVLVYLAIIPSL